MTKTPRKGAPLLPFSADLAERSWWRLLQFGNLQPKVQPVLLRPFPEQLRDVGYRRRVVPLGHDLPRQFEELPLAIAGIRERFRTANGKGLLVG